MKRMTPDQMQSMMRGMQGMNPGMMQAAMAQMKNMNSNDWETARQQVRRGAVWRRSHAYMHGSRCYGGSAMQLACVQRTCMPACACERMQGSSTMQVAARMPVCAAATTCPHPPCLTTPAADEQHGP